jgi:hypothetical protein
MKSPALKTHWLFRGETGTYAWCQISARGPVTDDPAEVTCRSCLRYLARERELAAKEAAR